MRPVSVYAILALWCVVLVLHFVAQIIVLNTYYGYLEL